MKSFLTLLLLLALTNTVLAQKQKIEVKDEAVLLDGAKYALIEQDGCRIMDTQCVYYLKSLDGKRQVAVKQLEFVDPAEMSASHPDGRVLYLQYVFLASGTKAETPFPTTLHLRAIDVARKVAKGQLFANGTLNEQAVSDFVTTNGMPFADRQKELAGPKVIVIEK
ncbi:hypothetical protein SAMN02745146_2504 [Hymenobacter daecheongensis DSM 21074]|uniref:Uncharacterized protein n=1 Tax=Hymenobacter daecheongensis DSM 21074 TaxID=1121955 RepID=A0A1M6H3V7_9BACT|nr:hypothetical protein [Hymenobacter daecheongensis]SHJ16796.1 hypothetical protein SAMN02745146_2504 [Hymenobacter daecheongensis DSM 21074]